MLSVDLFLCPLTFLPHPLLCPSASDLLSDDKKPYSLEIFSSTYEACSCGRGSWQPAWEICRGEQLRGA